MKKHLFIAAAAVLALASCTTSEETFQGIDFAQEEAQNNAIQFGTYMGTQVATRSGYTGNIGNTELKQNSTDLNNPTDDATNGFGVFAYYTGDKSYDEYRAKSGNQYPNFMYNQRVRNATGSTGYVGADGSGNMWYYTPMKYWPNEVQNGAVDDQDNNASNNQATTTNTNGGNLSFFAYAPYVPVKNQNSTPGIQSATVADKTYGIIAFSGNKYSGNGTTRYSDPYLTYRLKDDGTKVVDLLWGTKGTTGKNVLGSGNTGATYNASGTNYEKSILNSYSLNADLTKQKTNGTVDFAFKHALAKVGGSEINGTTPSGASSHGLMIIADIDDQKGAEVGGHRTSGSGTIVDNLTKITVKGITIVAKSKVSDGTHNPGETGYSDTYLKEIQGIFNLATGKWEVERTINSISNTASSVTGLTHKITTSGTGVSGTLNSTIAEPDGGIAEGTAAWDGLVAGVPDRSAVNVYGSEAAPLVFIPGTWPELTVTVEYLVRTKDESLAKGYSEVPQKITKKITFTDAVELNKQYNLLIHLGLTSVKFTATVSNWDVETGTTPNIDTDGDGAKDAVGHEVYVPINVQ